MASEILYHFLFNFQKRIKKLLDTYFLSVYQQLGGVKYSNTSSSPTMNFWFNFCISRTVAPWTY